MAKNLSIRFSAASSAAAITPSSPSSSSSSLVASPSNACVSIESSVASDDCICSSSSNRLLSGGYGDDDDGEDSENRNHSIDDNRDFRVRSSDGGDTLNRTSAITSNSNTSDTCDIVNDFKSSLDAGRGDASTSNISSKQGKKQNSITVGAKVDKFVRQLQENVTGKQETTTIGNNRYKFAKSVGDSLEIISGNQAESSDGWPVSITVTPALSSNVSPQSSDRSSSDIISPSNSITTTTATNAVTVTECSSTTISSPSSSGSNWLSDMKLYNSIREKWRNEKDKKCADETAAGGANPGDYATRHINNNNNNNHNNKNGNSTGVKMNVSTPTLATSLNHSASLSSNLHPYNHKNSQHNNNNNNNSNNNSNQNQLTGNNFAGGGSHHLCRSCSLRHIPNNAIPVSYAIVTTAAITTDFDHYCDACRCREAVEVNQHGSNSSSKCPTPRRTPTPPPFTSPITFDPSFDPFLSNNELSMIFPFGKEKKEKRDKEPKKSKLFGSNTNLSAQSKENEKARKKAAKEKEKEQREKEKSEKEKDCTNSCLMKIISAKSPPFSSPNNSGVLLAPSSAANGNSSSTSSSFLSIISSGSTKNLSPSQSRSSSTENIANFSGGYETTTFPNEFSKQSKGAKMSSSKSMVSFRKLMKNEIDEDAGAAALLDDEYASIRSPARSRSIALRPKRGDSFRLDSPTNDAGNNSTFSVNEDAVSMSSNSSGATSSSADRRASTHIEAILTETIAPQQQPLDSDYDHQRQQQSTNHSSQSFFSLHSGLFSWAMCFSYAYYIFALIVALVSLLISLISPLPAFVNGFVLGFIFTFLLVTVVIMYAFSNYVFVRSPDDEQRRTRTLLSSREASLKRSKHKRLLVNGFNAECTGFSGWVYEFIGEYEQREKNGFVSRLVFLALYGPVLFILTPAKELNEKRLKQLIADNKAPNIASQRIIDFSKQSHKRLTLYLTQNVRNQRKYIWSKKYPICVEFNDDRAISGGGYLVSGNDGEPIITPESITALPSLKLVIFARSCREKEQWFWEIRNSIDSPKSSESPKNSSLFLADSTASINSAADSTDSTAPIVENISDNNSSNSLQPQQYLRILTRRMNYHAFMRANVLNLEGIGPNGASTTMTPLTWFNVLLNRVSFDILNKPNWSAYIAKKLQRKLKKLRLPYFMESLTITEIDIGTTLPKFNSVPTAPVIDEGGVWIDFDVCYSGGFTMTLETKVNLRKLKKTESPSSESAAASFSMSSLSAAEPNLSTTVTPPPSSPMPQPAESPMLSPMSVPKQTKHWSGYKYISARVSSTSTTATTATGVSENEEYTVDSDSDLNSIGTSSEDEEPETAPADPDDADTDEKQRKLIRFVDRIASNQYFQKATQINFVRKAIEGVSNMSINLTVQINSLNGILAINIPESPSDRLWYGFRNEPTIQITARPKVGDHDVNVNYVSNFIEKKLRTEFFNYFVIPHMDDFFIPALNTNIEQFISVVP